MLPWLVGGLLVIKTFAAVSVGIASLRERILSAKDVIRITLLWAALTGTLAFAFYVLLPYPFATLAWCFAFTALAIPLARILLLPLALSVEPPSVAREWPGVSADDRVAMLVRPRGQPAAVPRDSVESA